MTVGSKFPTPRWFYCRHKSSLNLHTPEALKLIEVGKGEAGNSSHSQNSPGKEVMAELGPLEDQEAEPDEFEYLVSNIRHIITCLYRFSIAMRNLVPKECLHTIALIDVSYFEHWDIKHIDEKFCPADSQNNFRVAKYLIERLGKANTRRRQLLRYFEAHNKKISRYIDDPLKSAVGLLTNASKQTTHGSARVPENIPDPNRAATAYTTTQSQTTVSTINAELSQAVEIERDEDWLSQISYATSTNHTMRICVPSPPSEDAAFGGEPLECPYCFNIIKVRNRMDWKYVGDYAGSSYSMLNILGCMYLVIFSPISAHSLTAPMQTNYSAANASGLIMRYSSTGESGIVMIVRGPFHKG